MLGLRTSDGQPPFAMREHITPPLGKGGLGGGEESTHVLGWSRAPQPLRAGERFVGSGTHRTANPHPPNPPFPRGGVMRFRRLRTAWHESVRNPNVNRSVQRVDVEFI